MRLRHYLASQGVTVSDFAEVIGVTVQTVHRYLNGERLPKPDVMERIAAVSGGRVQPNDFYPSFARTCGGKPEPEPASV